MHLSPYFFRPSRAKITQKKKKRGSNVKFLAKYFARIIKSSTFAALFRTMKAFGRLAQLVQSICLTSRGSAVRIRQRPQRSLPFGRLFLFLPPERRVKSAVHNKIDNLILVW